MCHARARRRGRCRPEPPAGDRAEGGRLRRRQRRPTARRAISSATPSPTTWSSSTSACRCSTASACSRNGAAPGARCRSSSSPRATAGATRCRASTPAPTTMSPSPSISRRCWRASARSSAAPPATPPTRSNAGRSASTAASGRVTVDGNPVKLTSHEYKVLEYLMHHRDRVVSRTELIEHLYDQDFDRDSNTIEVFVGRLRKKVVARPDRDRARPRLPDRRTGQCGLTRSPFRLIAAASLWSVRRARRRRPHPHLALSPDRRARPSTSASAST